MKIFLKPFSFHGRIHRLEFGLSYLIYFILIFATDTLIEKRDDPHDFVSNLLTLILLIPPGWFIIAQGSKRCHDLGERGWWQINPFYWLWMFFKEGQPYPNKYGESTKGKYNIFKYNPFVKLPVTNPNNDINNSNKVDKKKYL